MGWKCFLGALRWGALNLSFFGCISLNEFLLERGERLVCVYHKSSYSYRYKKTTLHCRMVLCSNKIQLLGLCNNQRCDGCS